MKPKLQPSSRPNRGARGRGPRGDSRPKPSHDTDSPKGSPAKDSMEETQNGQVEDDDVSGKNICFVCADGIIFEAVYPCNHTVCHRCALRLRALMKDNHCALCRTQQDKIVITHKSGINCQDFSPEQLIYQEAKYGIFFEDRKTKDNVLSLLKLKCPWRGCGKIFPNWKELKHHAKDAHNREFCDICTRYKKAFTIEFPLYTSWGLHKHQKEGDDKIGFTGHPRCGFCQMYFYSDEELFVHCREKHERCFICDRNRINNRPEYNYYRDYSSLENHFREKHYACGVQSCLHKKFVVFESKLELQDHMVNTHPEIVGTSRQARIVETNFTFSRPTNNGFGSQLSTYVEPSVPVAPRLDTAVPAPLAERTEDSFPALGTQRPSNPSFNSPQAASVERFHANAPPRNETPDIIKRRLEERARMYLNYDVKRFETFQTLNSEFASGTIDAKTVIFEYKNLFVNIKVPEMEILVHELQGVYKAKSKQLQTALQSWAEKQAPTPGRQVGTATANMLSSTWAASRSASLRAGGLTTQDFPSLPASSSSASSSGTATPTSKIVRSTPSLSSVTKSLNNFNVNNGGTSVPSASASTSSLPYSRTSSSSSLTESAFPALPPSKVKLYPLKRSAAPAPAIPSVWDPCTQAQPAPTDSAEDPVGGDGRKQKGRKKQVLYNIGAFS